jgi:hypothetical protein
VIDSKRDIFKCIKAFQFVVSEEPFYVSSQQHAPCVAQKDFGYTGELNERHSCYK